MTAHGWRDSYRRGEYPGDLGAVAREALPSSGRVVSRLTWTTWLAVPTVAAAVAVATLAWWASPSDEANRVAEGPTAPTPSLLVEPSQAPASAGPRPGALPSGPSFAAADRPTFRQRTYPSRSLSAAPTSPLSRAQRQRLSSLRPSLLASIPSTRSTRSATNAATPSS